MRYETHSPRETQALAAALAKTLAARPPRTKRALVVALVGTLGSGKTSFVQGFARGLGVRRRTISPTFTIMRRYAVPTASPAHRRGFRSLVHVDAYRVHKPVELGIIHFDEWLTDPTAIVLIEWANLLSASALRADIRVSFAHGPGAHDRAIVISARPGAHGKMRGKK